MTTISSPGIGSGLDVNSIVTKLVSLEQQPIYDLQTQAAGIQTQLSSFGLLKSYTTNLHDIADKIAQPSFWSGTAATSSDAGSVGVSSSTTAIAGAYQVNVTQLAKAQSLASAAYAGTTSTVGSGTLHIQIGSWNSDTTAFTPDATKTAVDVTVAAGDTLDGIKTKINAANAGVTAAIVNDASGSRLVLTSNSTGVSNAVRITATDDDGNNTDAAGLSALAFDPATSAGQLSQTQQAKNALATVNGLAVTSTTNTLTDVIGGVTLTLSKETTSAVAVNVSLDVASLKKSVGDFAKAYNDVISYIAQQTKYDATTKKGGPLQGDRATLSLQSNLRSTALGSSTASATYATLSSIGLEVQTDGTLKVNDTKLNAALAANPGEVAKLFSATNATDPSKQGFAVKLRDLATKLTASDGMLTTHTKSLQDSIKRNQTQQQQLQARVDQMQARLTKQYSALDTMMSQMSATNSSLTQSLTALANQTAAITKGG